MALLLNDKGGMKIDGIISRYLCTSEQIKAGEFVNYINEASKVSDLQLNSGLETGDNIHACVLSDTKVFVTHKGGDTAQLVATVVEISNDTMKVITSYRVANVSDAPRHSNCVALDESRAMVIYLSSGKLTGIVCTFANSTISVGTPITLCESVITTSHNKAIKIEDDKVLIIHTENNNFQMGATLVTINGNAITVASHKALLGVNYTSIYMDSTLIDDGKVLVVHGSATNDSKLKAFIIKVSGTTITETADKQLFDEVEKGSYISICKLDTNKALVKHVYDKSMLLALLVLNIEGDTINVGKDIEIKEFYGNNRMIHVCEYEKDRAILFHFADRTIGSISVTILNADGDNVSLGKTVALDNNTGSGNVMFGVKLNDGRLFISHRYMQVASYLYGTLAKIKKEARVCDNLNDLVGIATKRAIRNQQVEIAVPKV